MRKKWYIPPTENNQIQAAIMDDKSLDSLPSKHSIRNSGGPSFDKSKSHDDAELLSSQLNTTCKQSLQVSNNKRQRLSKQASTKKEQTLVADCSPRTPMETIGDAREEKGGTEDQNNDDADDFEKNPFAWTRELYTKFYEAVELFKNH